MNFNVQVMLMLLMKHLPCQLHGFCVESYVFVFEPLRKRGAITRTSPVNYLHVFAGMRENAVSLQGKTFALWGWLGGGRQNQTGSLHPVKIERNRVSWKSALFLDSDCQFR
jgi:hypothetical protein